MRSLSPALSVIVPVLNEGATLAARLDALAALRARGAQVIVVDGGSTDASWMLAQGRADAVCLSARGRAAQMNAGANAARGAVLLFLHADTQLPPEGDCMLLQAVRAGAVWGRFDVRIDGVHPMLRVVAAMMNRRSRWTAIATGDQAIFVRRDAFERIGGFPDQPLMEDVEISRRLRRIAAPAALREQVLTSGRRWERHGVWRTILLMWRLRAAYFLGADPAALAERYGYRRAPAVAPAAVAVMAKAPQPGQAKTRLIPALGARGAARVQRRFALHTLRLARQAAQRMATGVQLWVAPSASQRFFRALRRSARAGEAVRWHEQPDGDLGARMAHAFATHFSAHPGLPLLLIGTDCPMLSPGHLLEAAHALAAHDAVLIPAEDGGYALIGLRRPCAALFDGVDWSTERVLAQTRERLRDAGLHWRELPALWDVDTPADWQRLQLALRGGGA